MATKEMTTREAYVAVIEGKVTEEVIAKFETLVVNLDASNAKKKAKAAEQRAEKNKADEGLKIRITEVITEAGEDGVTQTDIAEALEGVISAQKAGRLAKEIEGVVQFDKRIDKRKVKAYKLG